MELTTLRDALLKLLPPNLQASQEILEELRKKSKNSHFGEIKLFFPLRPSLLHEQVAGPFQERLEGRFKKY